MKDGTMTGAHWLIVVDGSAHTRRSVPIETSMSPTQSAPMTRLYTYQSLNHRTRREIGERFTECSDVVD